MDAYYRVDEDVAKVFPRIELNVVSRVNTVRGYSFVELLTSV